MLDRILFDNKPNVLLEKMMDKAAMSQRVIASNISNVNTPGYERRGVSFGVALQKALRPSLTKLATSDPRHMPSPDWARRIKPEVVKIEDGYWNGINNVNVEEEMVELAKNQLDFDISSRLMSIRFNQLKTAIRSRR